MLHDKTKEKFAILGMLYACLWEYLDHFAEVEHWSDILPFKKDEVQTAAKHHYDSIMTAAMLGPDLAVLVQIDYEEFLGYAVKIEKVLGSETINDPQLRGHVRRFATYLQAKSQRFTELAGDM